MTDALQVGTDTSFRDHCAGPDHPDTPERLDAIQVALAGFGERLGRYRFEAAPLEAVHRVHHPRYVESLAATAGTDVPLVMDTGDTTASAHTYHAALMGAGAAMGAVDAVMRGDTRRAFAFPRPPGHHAEVDRAMGFCFLNNIAIAAQYAIDHYGLRRVAIVDWDAHHGNGTQRIFAARPEVLTISSHVLRLFPGTGHPRERGWGAGQGYTVNLPLSANAGDDEFCRVHQRITLPLLRQFRPELLLISAGFDPHELEPLCSLRITGQGFYRLSRMLFGAADRLCEGRTVLVLEGGFDLVGLEEGVTRVVEAALADASDQDRQINVDNMVEARLERIAGMLREQWPSLV
mgnify:CR=1 FL=1